MKGQKIPVQGQTQVNGRLTTFMASNPGPMYPQLHGGYKIAAEVTLNDGHNVLY
jgi:hypothetical protein